MESKRQDREGIVILAISGDLTMDSYPLLKETFQKLLENNPVHIILNLSGASIVGSSAIGALVAFRREVENRGGSLALAALSPMFAQVLELLKLTEFFAIYGDEDAAVAALLGS